MASFIELQDSPMFHKQVGSLEQTSDELKDRCQRLYGACKKFMAALGEACNGDTAFADALEAFSGGQDDPVSMSIGGPVISKFINAFRELSTYKEHLHSQVEHVLIDRLMDFMTVDLQDAKESRQRFDKSTYAYDQAREKFVSLKKSAREDVAAELEEDLQNSKSVFERSRFSLVNALMNVEAKKKYQFLESFSAIMDAHLRYFKLGYELLSQMEPFIHQFQDIHKPFVKSLPLRNKIVLTYAQQSKEVANIEQDKLAKRIQEFRTQAEMDNIHASRNLEASTGGDGRHKINMGSYKNAEAIMETTANGAVQTIKQGYLLKRSASLRADRKRRFFVLDSSGTLYYYRNKVTMGPQSNYSIGAAEQNNGMFGRFRSKHQRSSSLCDEKTGCRTIDLRTSTIKIDANDTDLRLCFRIISPSKTYILQAENAAERMDWINKINGAISSLFNSQFLQQDFKTDNPANSVYDDGRSAINSQESLQNDTKHNQAGPVSSMLRQIPGNDICAECSSPEPDWASLNLGILMCIECSGAHRNLGVHISKVRSITLDVKVWEPTILELFRNLGNGFCNSVWEEVLRLPYESLDKSNSLLMSITKPCPRDDIYQKEKYIQLKYAEKLLVSKEVTLSKSAVITSLWDAVKSNSLREVYRLIIISVRNSINATYDEVDGVEFYHHVHTPNSESNDRAGETKNDPSTCDAIDDSTGQKNCLQGCSLLHLAIQDGNSVMVELLLQFGANINLQDYHGRTPLHHCIRKANIPLSKYLLKRGARPSIKDGGGLSSLERSMEMGAITDEELFVLLTASD